MSKPILLVVDAAEVAQVLEGAVFDAGTIDKAEITDAGFLKAPARITRTGVFVYRNADGSLRRELRLPEEVFAEDSLRTLALVPVTREHPEPLGTPVTVDNRKQFDVGVVGGDVRREGEHIAATIQIEDAAAIGDVQNGRRRELSAGYNRKLELKPGVWNGIPYDGVQREIRYNHVALTVVGRAGPESRIRLDSAACVMVCDASAEQQPEARPMKRKIVVDGISYEIECEDSTLAVLTKAMGDRDTKVTSLDSKLVEATKRAETERARADNAETELKKAQGIVADSAKPEKVQELVKARLELERVAKPLLVDSKGQEPDVSALSDTEIKRKVILVHDSDAKLEGASSEYVDGRYAGAVKALTTGKTAAKAAVIRAVTGGTGGQAVTVDADESRRKLREESENAWQKPLGERAEKAD